jgi:hypothetical protein
MQSKFKITFKQMPLDFESEVILDFLDTNWSNKITNKYPVFLKVKGVKSKKDKLKVIKDCIREVRKGMVDEIKLGLKNVKSDWQKIENDIFLTLFEIIQTGWPKKEITALISINPIYPRFLDDWNFCVSQDNKYSNIIISHEISHFLYFKKFKEVFPKIKRDKYESPNKEWILSEIITPIILNDLRMRKILGGDKSGFYEEHKMLKLNGKSVIKIIEDLYKEFVVDKKDFTKFLIKSLDLIKQV